MTTVAPRALLGATLRSHRGRILAAAAFLGGHQVCEALVPVAIGVTLDVGFAGETAWPLVACLAGMLALFLVLNQCWRWYARLGEGAAFDEAHRRRVGGLRGLLARRDADPPGGSGELVTILTGDADSHARWSTWIPGLAGAVAALAVCGVVLFSTDAVIAAVLLGTAVVVSAALLALSPLLAARFERQQAALGRTLDLGADLTAGLDTLRGLRAVGAAIARFRTRSDAARDAAVKAGYSASLQTGLTVLGSSVVVLVAIALAGARWLAGEMSVGELVALVGIAQFITEPLTALGHYVKFASISWASTRRLATLPDAAADEPAPAGPAARTVQDDGNPLVVRPGELVAVVAETVPPLALPGATTRLDEPRTAYLFRGTVAENLRLGRDASDDELDAALAAADAEFVAHLPGGVESGLDDGGATLSGGQRQRLALARALLADADLLVLTDPTSAIDSVTELRVAGGLRAYRAGRPGAATVVVSTSPPLLASADRVVHVRADGTRADGTHEELLGADPSYVAAVSG